MERNKLLPQHLIIFESQDQGFRDILVILVLADGTVHGLFKIGTGDDQLVGFFAHEAFDLFDLPVIEVGILTGDLIDSGIDGLFGSDNLADGQQDFFGIGGGSNQFDRVGLKLYGVIDELVQLSFSIFKIRFFFVTGCQPDSGYYPALP